MWFRTYSLYVFIPAFILIGIAAMVHEIRQGRDLYHSEWGNAGTVAHGPAEFPDIFDFNPIEGLDTKTGEIHVAPPPISEENWPCSQCHSTESNNSKRRTLEDMHQDIVLQHGERWCLDCHDSDDRDKLRLASGEKISFEQSYRLCGQCHGPTYQDWRLGIHGKRTGYWNGPKRYLLCVNCHWPHKPRFKSMTPMPPPVRPDFIGSAPNGVQADTPANAVKSP